MEVNFTRPVRIDKEEFLKLWRMDMEDRSKREPGHSDQFDRQHFELHEKDRPNVMYNRVELTQTGVDNVILPHNAQDIYVSSGGEPIGKVIARYLDKLKAQELEPDIDRYPPKVRGLMEHFTQLADKGRPLGLRCMFVYDDVIFAERDLNKHNFRHHGEGKLYAANYHRFVAYGLWIEKYGYKPIGVCCCTSKALQAI